MYNCIISSACLYGSVYLFSKSLLLTNKIFLENKKIKKEIIIVNGLVFIISGSIALYSYSLLKR